MGQQRRRRRRPIGRAPSPGKRLGDRRPPVHHEPFVLGVRDRQPADVNVSRLPFCPAVPPSADSPSARPASATGFGQVGLGWAGSGWAGLGGPSSPGCRAPVDAPEDSASRPHWSFPRRFTRCAPGCSLGADWNVPPSHQVACPSSASAPARLLEPLVSPVKVGLHRQVSDSPLPNPPRSAAELLAVPPGSTVEKASQPAAVPCGVPGQTFARIAEMVHSQAGRSLPGSRARRGPGAPRPVAGPRSPLTDAQPVRATRGRRVLFSASPSLASVRVDVAPAPARSSTSPSATPAISTASTRSRLLRSRSRATGHRRALRASYRLRRRPVHSGQLPRRGGPVDHVMA